MARAALAVGLVVLVVASGCLTAEPAGTGPAETTSAAVPFEMPDRTVEHNRNPWSAGPITVVVEDTARMDRNIHPQVMKTLRYWEEAIDPGQRYAPEFHLVSESDSPDVRVEIVQTVEGCGVHDDDVALGCAPIIPTNASVTDVVTVQVRAGHSPETTRAILKHEFGHVLGYRHGEGPDNVMAEDLAARSPENVANASSRAYPWASKTLDVTIVADEPAIEERQRVEDALEYYERGADGTVASPPRFSMVSDPEDADVVVDLQDSVADCDVVGSQSSCAKWDGPDVDDDGAPEYITDARIVVGSDGHDRAGWHVGYWLGRSLWTHGVPNPFWTDRQPPANSW
jgi:hypothetical protein